MSCRFVKTEEEIAGMRAAGKALAEVRDCLISLIEPGLCTLELDRAAAKKIRELGASPAFLGYHGFPGVICASINEEVIHGIPKRRRTMVEGDIVSIDVGLELDGFFSDMAFTAAVGKVSKAKARLVESTRAALAAGIERARPGKTVGDIGAAIAHCVHRRGFQVVQEYSGHGIGRSLHEKPPVPNLGKPGEGTRLQEGMTLAIEPMVNAGVGNTEILADRWTVVTADRRPSAHFEHTVLLRDGRAEILTA